MPYRSAVITIFAVLLISEVTTFADPPTGSPAINASSCAAGEWNRIWNDEFDGPNVDPAKWSLLQGPAQWNGELQYYIPQDAYVENGNLRIKSEQLNYCDPTGSCRDYYTSGMLTSQGLFSRTYGYFELRARLPVGKGIWPAFWLLADAGWPPEIDVMEMLGDVPNRIYMTNHWYSDTASDILKNVGVYRGPDFSQAFHTFGVDWNPGEIRWYIDGIERFQSFTGIPAENMHIILNTAVGGYWPGNPDDTTVFPQYYDIDYVRVYHYTCANRPSAPSGLKVQ